MDIKFKILAVHPEFRSVTVHYSTDIFTEGTTLNVTIWPDPLPTGQELTDYILAQAPIAWLITKSKIMLETPDMSEFASKINLEHSVEIDMPTEPVTDVPSVQDLLSTKSIPVI